MYYTYIENIYIYYMWVFCVYCIGKSVYWVTEGVTATTRSRSLNPTLTKQMVNINQPAQEYPDSGKI